MILGESGVRIEADHLERYRFAQTFSHGRDVLDVACGSGYGTKMLAEAGASHAVGVDISQVALDIARDRYSGPATFELGDISIYGDEGSFDLITCFETIEHVTNPQRALSNLHRLLRSNGILLISSPNRAATSPRARTLADDPRNPFHLREYAPAELRRELESLGFSVDAVTLGQRMHLRMHRFLAAAYRRFFSPQDKASPKLRPVPWWAMPRYFVLVARPQQTH